QLAELNLGLENRLDMPVGLLSGGQRQSLSLVMAVSTRPKLLLLDEHTAALDPRTAKLVMDTTVRAVEELKLTTLMVTHNMEH
ncbi:ATP-binding cassette domain-containing protein, partial [Klebsiella pneumoniae]|uniref:ATP-binding cassette domain-containing protein n=2 Tax=Pseudomonadota TaxID=1224 RepID=UPI0013D18A95